MLATVTALYCPDRTLHLEIWEWDLTAVRKPSSIERWRVDPALQGYCLGFEAAGIPCRQNIHWHFPPRLPWYSTGFRAPPGGGPLLLYQVYGSVYPLLLYQVYGSVYCEAGVTFAYRYNIFIVLTVYVWVQTYRQSRPVCFHVNYMFHMLPGMKAFDRLLISLHLDICPSLLQVFNRSHFDSSACLSVSYLHRYAIGRLTTI